MEYTRDNITTDDIQRAISSGGYWLIGGEWDGKDPIKAYGVNPYTPFAAIQVEISLDSVLNWLNVESGFFDPIALGM